MASTILHAGHTVFVKETADFGTVLSSGEGEVFAASPELGVCVMIGLPFGAALGAITIHDEGDVVIAIDSYTTQGMCTHLPDIFHLASHIITEGCT